MKKRLLSALLAMAMMLTMVPAAFATDADADDTVQETVSSTTANTDDNGDTGEDSGSDTSGSLPAADEDGVIKLTSDASIDSESWSMSDSLTIDLDDHTLTITNGKTITVPESETLTIKSGKITANSFNALMAVFSPLKDATLVLDSVEFTTSGSAILPSGTAAKVEVKDSTIKTTGVYTVGTNANKVNGSYEYGSNFVIELTNSTFTADSTDNDNCAVQINVPGTLNMDKCTVTGDRQGMMVRAGTANITNSTIKTTGGFTTDKGYTNNANWGSGNEVPTAAITIGNYVNGAASSYEADAKVTITNATVTGTTSYPAIYVDANTKYKSDVTISGEETSVTGDITKGRQTADGQINISITGGTFSSQVDEAYLPTGYECTESNTTWTVQAKQGLEAEVSTGGDNTVTATVDGSYTGNETSSSGEESSDGDVSTDSGVVIIDVSASGDDSSSIKSAEVTIGSNALTSINNNTSVNTVVLETNVGILTIDAEAWDSMTDAADESGIVVTVTDASTENSNPVYEVTATAGDTNAFSGDAKGTVTVSVPYTLPENKAKVKVYCTDNGMEDMNGKLETGEDGSKRVKWTTSHFSTFEIPAYSDTDEVAYLASGEGASVTVGTLSDALSAMASNGGTITLLKNIEVTNTSVTSATEAIYTLPNGVTLDGAGHSITAKAEGWQTNSESYPQKNPILGVTAAGAKVTIKNLTIVGHESTRHGVNVWSNTMDADNQPNVTLENVTIKDCGTAAIVVSNGKVTATGLTTSGNTWGAVNVDNSGSFTLTGADNNMAEPVKIWTEKPAGSENATTITLTNSNFSSFDDVKGVGDNLKGYTYYTDDVSELGEAYNESTKTVYEDLDTALSSGNVSANDVITVVKNASLNSSATIPENATLKVAEGVTLTIEENATLTNNGTLENSGIISGNVAGTGKQTSIVTFSVTPSDATIVVKDSDGNEVSAVGGKYALENGKNYTYTVSKSGYRTQTSTFTVTKAETITVTLSTSGGGGGGSSSSSGYAVSVSSASNGSVSVSPKNASKGATVTITVTPNSGYELDELTVTDKNGDTVKLTNKGNGKYTFTMPASKVTVKATFEKAATEPETPVFTDVSTSAYYYDAVEWAVEEGVTSGTTATTFSPNASCTRAQMVTFLWRANGSPKAGGTNPFTDVKPDAYYYDAVLWAVEKGITSGTSATTFSPDATVTRGQTVTFLYRANGSPAVSGSSPFADVAADAYYAAAVQWAVAENVTAGTSATTFSPNNACTRAQIVTFLYRDMA